MIGISLMVQRLRLYAPNEGNLGLIPVWGTSSYVLQLKAPMVQLRPGKVK